MVKAELVRLNAALAAENHALRTENGDLRAKVASLTPREIVGPMESPRRRAMRIARALSQQGHKVLVRGDQVIDQGPRH